MTRAIENGSSSLTRAIENGSSSSRCTAAIAGLARWHEWAQFGKAAVPTLATTFLEHRKALGQYLRRRTGCADAADELLHELWLRSHDVTAAGILNPAAYLFRTAANVAFDWRRRETVLAGRLVAADEGEAIADDAPSPERLAQASEIQAVLRAAIDALPPKCRQAFLLCRIEGLTMREAGRRMGVSERTIENHLAKATVHCRKRLLNAGCWP